MEQLKARLLETFPVFRQFSPEARSRLAEDIAPLRVPAGAVLFDAGYPCQAFPMLLDGVIRVAKTGETGRELLLYRVGPGESCILTSSCLLGNAIYPARGVAESALTGLTISKTAFNHWVAHFAPFRHYIFELFAARLSSLMALVEEVAFHKLDQRLAALLVAKGNRVRTTHQNLADELGSAREIVSRLLKGFQDNGWVQLGRRQIDVIDPDALKRAANDA